MFLSVLVHDKGRKKFSSSTERNYAFPNTQKYALTALTNQFLLKLELNPELFSFPAGIGSVQCLSAFSYMTEPGSCNIFYHCNNWQPFLKRCPPGLAFDDRNLICNWPHNVNCVDGYRAKVYTAYTYMRSARERGLVSPNSVHGKEEDVKEAKKQRKEQKKEQRKNRFKKVRRSTMAFSPFLVASRVRRTTCFMSIL